MPGTAPSASVGGVRGPRTALALAVVAGALAGCGGSSELGFTTVTVPPPPAAVRVQGAVAVARYERGKAMVPHYGCFACHHLGDAGNTGPGPELTHVGSRLPPAAIRRALVRPVAPMPRFDEVIDDPGQLDALVAYLAALR